jgi:transposase
VRVVAVELEEEHGRQAVVVDLARPARRWLCCSRCGYRTRAGYDRSLRCWRHLDLGRTPCLVRLEVCRLDCPSCGIVAEAVPFARVGSRFTRAFEDTCVWLVRDAPKTVVSRLMRVDWATVGRMIERVVTEAGARGEDWLLRAAPDRHRRGLLPQGPSLPALRRLPRQRPDRLGAAGQEPRRPPCVLRRARRGGLRPP